MLSIDKKISCEPDCMARIRRKCSNWEDLTQRYPDDYHALRNQMIERENSINGIMFCTYCECRINNLSDVCIEHIKPRDSYPQMEFDYSNIIISCKSRNTCTQAKGNQWDENFINPVEEDPKELLSYNLNGEIRASDIRAQRTIGLLNLNYPKLVNIRRVIIKQSLSMPRDEPGLMDSFENQPSLVEFIKQELW